MITDPHTRIPELTVGRSNPYPPQRTGMPRYSMYSVTEGEDVNGTAKFCVPWTVSLEQFAINSARQQFVSESVQRAAKDVSVRSWTITNTTDWLIAHALTSPPTQYRLSGRQFYRSKDPTNSIKVLKEQNATKVKKTQKKTNNTANTAKQ